MENKETNTKPAMDIREAFSFEAPKGVCKECMSQSAPVFDSIDLSELDAFKNRSKENKD